jgi:hypothetical protein
MSFPARFLEENEEIKVVDLLSTVFKGWPHFDLSYTSVQHWRWKYSYPRKGIVVVVPKDDKIVGCHHTGFLRIKIGDKISECTQAMDLGTHPDFRGMGVNSSISKFSDEQVKRGIIPDRFCYWVSTNPIVLKINDKIGNPVFPGKLSFLIRIKDVDKQLEQSKAENKFINKIGYQGLSLIGKINRPIKIRSGEQAILSTIEKFSNEFNDFWVSIKTNYDFIIEKTPDYLNWRYADPHGGNYRISVARENGELVGYLVTRINRYKKDYPEGYLVDFVTVPGREYILEQLVFEALSYFDDNNVNIIYCWIIKGHSYERILKSNGFVDSRRDINVSYNVPSNFQDVDKFTNAPPERLHFTYGSTDWI